MRMRLMFGMAFLLLAAPFVWSQDGICEGLRAVHSKYGDSVFAYLSETGKTCLEPAESVKEIPTSATLFAESGSGDWAGSVDLSFSPGVYSFELSNFVRAVDGYISFQKIIALPEGCLPISIDTLQFPRHLRIEQDCRVLATMDVSAFYSSGDKEWQARIAKFDSDSNTSTPASEWSQTGRGDWSALLDLSFSPGVWQFNTPDFARGDDGYISFQEIITLPEGCLPILIDTMQFPTQLRVEQNCRILATSDVSVFSAAEEKDWVVTIVKLT